MRDVKGIARTLLTVAEFKAEALKSGGKILPVRRELAGAVIRTEGEGDDKPLSFILSTADRDRYGDVVEQTGWDLTNYEKNKVMLWAHDYRQAPVGSPSFVGVKNSNLVGEAVKFQQRDVHEFGWAVGQMYRQGFLNAVSVGFQPSEWTYDDDGGIRFIKSELLEFSAVPIPANPNALQLGLQSIGASAKGFVEWIERSLDEKESGLLVPRSYAEGAYKALKGASVQVPGVVEETDTVELSAEEDAVELELEALRSEVSELRGAVVELTGVIREFVSVQRGAPAAAPTVVVNHQQDADSIAREVAKSIAQKNFQKSHGG